MQPWDSQKAFSEELDNRTVRLFHKYTTTLENTDEDNKAVSWISSWRDNTKNPCRS